MSAHVCEIFDNLYTQFPDDDDEVHRTNGKSLLYETFCPKNGDEHQKCSTDLDRISAGFGYLVLQLFDNVDFEEDHEDQKGNYVYYGLLWASDKLQQSNKKNNTSIGLYDFFNDYIINGEWYGEIKEHVEPKMNLLNKEIDIDMMKDIYSIFKDMCKIFSNNDDDIDNINFMSYYDSVKSCGENILKKNSNHVNRDTSGSSCLSLYYVLKNIYNDFKNDCIAIMNPPTTALPDIPSIEEIKKTLESNSEKLDSQDCGSENSDCVEKCELTIPENELEQPQNDKTVEKLLDIEIKEEICFENLKPELPKIDPELEKFEIEFASFETKLPKFETELPDVLGELEVIDIETDEKVLLDELEFSNIEVEYPDAQDYFFDIDTDLSFFEDKYSDLENDPQNIVDALFVSENSIPNIVDELYVPEDDLSYPMVKPKIIDFEWPDLNIEENDSDNQSQPHQTNTLEFDDPFKNPEKFSDSIMCKLYGPKSVYCNRIICNRIKIGVIALSIPIILVFIYKYFPWKRTKKPKRTKKMKRVVNLLDRKKTKKIDINSIDGKKTMQTIINSIDSKKTVQITINSDDKKKATKRIINSNDKKKATKRNIHSDNGKASLLFSIYKQMQLSPMPFIHLFMLLIFFIFKRKKDFIE